jgi:hypothetical protein
MIVFNVKMLAIAQKGRRSYRSLRGASCGLADHALPLGYGRLALDLKIDLFKDAGTGGWQLVALLRGMFQHNFCA